MTTPGFDYPARVAGLEASLERHGLDAAVLSVGTDLPYFTGYEAMPSERLTMLVVRPGRHPTLFLPNLEVARVEPGDFTITGWGELDSPVDLVASELVGAQGVAIGDHTWSVFLIALQAALPATKWVAASGVTSTLRMVKEDAEIALLRAAGQAVDRALARVPGEIRFSGRTEAEVAAILRLMTVEEGHREASFSIVASGPNSASPHHEPEDRVIETGDLVVCDFGGRLGGYCSDVTRTFSVGEPGSRETEIHAAVESANRAAREAVAPGVTCEDVDRAARGVIVEAGFGEAFIHRTGHGIGLEVHEHPYIVAGNSLPLEPGMAFSIEPGIYLGGRYGVRIEDIVVCSESGREDLNNADRGLVVVE